MRRRDVSLLRYPAALLDRDRGRDPARKGGTMSCDCGETHHPNANYYVSVRDGPRFDLLAGPFDDHAIALAWVDRATAAANDVWPWSHFYAFGTVAMQSTYDKPGKLNERLAIAARDQWPPTKGT
jgi:hypothetical protein